MCRQKNSRQGTAAARPPSFCPPASRSDQIAADLLATITHVFRPYLARETAGASTKTRELGPSFDAPDANPRIACKIHNRGMLCWRDFDTKYFKIDRKLREAAILKDKVRNSG